MPATSTIKPTVSLRGEQITFFHREGYLALPVLTTPEEVAWLRGVYDRLFEEQAGRGEGGQFDLAGHDEEGQLAKLPQILNPLKYAPELAETRYRANARAIAEQLFGPEVEPKGEHMIFKPARYGAETPWHQDQAYHDPALYYRNVNFWMPLQEATLENGCLQFVPRSHTWDVQPHHILDPKVHAIEVDGAEPYREQAVPCPVPAGGATLHHSYLLHYAGPNRSALPRRAYIIKFGLPVQKRARPLDFHWLKQQDTARQARAKHAAKGESTA